jgi:non-heme chloroperoxidase
MEGGLKDDRDAFFDQFTTMFFSAGDEPTVSETERQEAVALCRQSDQRAALGCTEAFGMTDFREDLPKITVPTRRAARPEREPRRRVQRGAAGVPGEVTGGVP